MFEAGPGQIVGSRVLQGRPRVLVIDDDSDFAQMLAETISERGWEGHPSSDAADARERVLDGSYSALFIDLVLVGGSGVKLLREALASQPRRPAVLMSGFDASHEAILEALHLGPVMFVPEAHIDGRPLTRRSRCSAICCRERRRGGAWFAQSRTRRRASGLTSRVTPYGNRGRGSSARALPSCQR